MFILVKLGIENAMLEKIIEKLANLFLETVKQKLSQSEFLDVCAQHIKPECSEKLLLLWEGIDIERNFLSQVLSAAQVNHPQYSNLNWRIEYLVNPFQNSKIGNLIKPLNFFFCCVLSVGFKMFE